MNLSISKTSDAIAARTFELFEGQRKGIVEHTSRLFAWLMIFQWFFAFAVAAWFSPLTNHAAGGLNQRPIWLALILGGVVTAIPVLLAQFNSGKTFTRHTIAVGQMLMSALLIHLTGGRIETHFHVFGSLAILAFYRDWRVLISATAVVCMDDLLLGQFWPQSVYGVPSASVWRSLEHAGWVIFEVTFLIIAIRKSLSEMLQMAERQAKLESMKEETEYTMLERTSDLMREIEERKMVQEQLAQAQKVARMGSWEWDIVHNKIVCSEETQQLYGHKPEDAASALETCMERVHPDDLSEVNKIIAQSLRTCQPFVCDHRVVMPDGEERVIHGRGQILVNAQRQPIKMFGTVQDVTEAKRGEEALRRSEEQLRQSQKMEAVGRLAGGVAHDFNNLLTVIGGYCSLCLQTIDETHPLHKSINEIQRAAERAGSLTGQLLAFSRKQVLQPRVIHLNEVVRGMEKMLRRLIGEDIELNTVFGSPLGYVKTDPSQIEQVLMNLAVNARDAMPRGGKLTISTSRAVMDTKSNYRNRTLEPGEYVMLAISDNGMGMTDEVKAHLFEPFFTTKGVGKGTGLGLATCYGIITQSDGDIRVYSELNHGTTFKIYLPCTQATPESASTEFRRLPVGAESILVVEDEPSVRELAVLVLQERGYKVQESGNAFEALELIRKSGPFDLVLTDVIMPQMSGKILFDQIKSQIPHTKVLLMSGYTNDALAHHGVLDEGLSFLEKPFSPLQLTRKVREVLDATDEESEPLPDLEHIMNG